MITILLAIGWCMVIIAIIIAAPIIAIVFIIGGIIYCLAKLINMERTNEPITRINRDYFPPED